MKRLLLPAAALFALVAFSAQKSEAQFVTYFSPVVAPAPVVVYRPVAPTVVFRPAPVVYTVARPVVAAPAVVPVAVTRTRWRPFLGGTVTRVRYGYAPVYGF
jgi:hypothetical protein